MPWYIWLGMYVTGFVFVSRYVYWYMRNDYDYNDDDQIMLIMSTAFPAIFAGVFWPVALLGLVLIHPKRTDREVWEENKRLQNRIYELEQELDIGNADRIG